MACLEMFNSEQQQQHQCSAPPMSPRISFSNDFVDTQQAMKQYNEQQQQQRNSSSAAAVASNFEFSVSNFNMMQSADELFSKGRLLPFKQESNGTSTNKITTLRDELLNDDDDDDGDIFSMKPPKGPVKWKEFLGLNKRTHVLSSKNNNKGDHINNKVISDHGSKVVMERVVEGNESMLIQKEDEEEKQVTKISDELVLTDGGCNCRDNVEIGI